MFLSENLCVLCGYFLPLRFTEKDTKVTEAKCYSGRFRHLIFSRQIFDLKLVKRFFKELIHQFIEIIPMLY